MSGGGGKNTPSGSTTVTNTSNSAPWSVQQPYLQDAFAQAQNLFQNNTPQYFPGATYATPNAAQNTALGTLENTSGYQPYANNAVTFNNDLLSGVYTSGDQTLNQAMKNATNPMANIAGAGILNNISGTNLGTNNPGFDALSSFSSGNTTNPYLADVSSSILSQAIPGIQKQFINGGGLSSPEAAYATAQGGTAALAPTLASLFENAQNRQLNAATTLGSQALQGGALQASAAGALGGLQNSALSSAINAYGGDVGRMIQGLSLSPATLQAATQPAQQQYSAGSQQQQLDQASINDAIQRFNYSQTLPYQQLNEYLGQIGGNYGSQGSGSTTTPFFTNPAGSALGGALGGAQLGTSILGSGGLGLLSNGAAAGGGAGLGALLSIFSDRRVKADIRKVGMLGNGLPIYAFRYKGELTPRIGLMADEVEKIHPEAVTVDFLGLKSVDYALAVQ